MSNISVNSVYKITFTNVVTLQKWKKYLICSKKNGSQFLVHWLEDLNEGRESLPEDFDWDLCTERIYSIAFRESRLNPDYAKSLTLVCVYLFKEGNQGAMLSALNVRLNVLDLDLDHDINGFFAPNVIISTVKNLLDTDLETVILQSANWKSENIETIRKLRVIKNWLKIILMLEEITAQKYSEFDDWKAILPMLP